MQHIINSLKAMALIYFKFFTETQQSKTLLTKIGPHVHRLRGHSINSAIVLLIAAILPTLSLGCAAAWRKITQSPPPQYTVFLAPSFDFRTNCTAWMSARPDIRSNMADWNREFTKAMGSLFPWVPDKDRLFGEAFTSAAKECGQTTNTVYLESVTNHAKSFFYGCPDSYFGAAIEPSGEPDPNKQLRHKVHEMLVLADRENEHAFATNVEELKPTIYKKTLPPLLSSTLPVGISVYSSWPEIVGGSTNTPQSEADKTNHSSVALGSLLISIQSVSNGTSSGGSKPPDTKAPAPKGSSILDFVPDQQVTMSVSTMLNSAFALDRIDYVSTYVYLYPWTMTVNGDVLLEQEFWRRFFSVNTHRNKLLRTNDVILRTDMLRAIDDMQVFVHDVNTKVDLADIDLGTLQQTFTRALSAGLEASAKGSGSFGGLSATSSYAASKNAVESIAAKLQIDQRSTYTSGDFFRISQRGMQSADIAGRISEQVSLHIPAAANETPVLSVAKDTEKVCEVSTFTQPLYSQINAFTFSIIVARRPIALVSGDAERYGLDDRKSAYLVVSVTTPRVVKLWQNERGFDEITTWDVYGETNTPAQILYFKRSDTDKPSPLYLASFDYTNQVRLFEAIRNAPKSNGIAILPTEQVAGNGKGGLQIGLFSEGGYSLDPLPNLDNGRSLLKSEKSPVK